jgi:Ion channel
MVLCVGSGFLDSGIKREARAVGRRLMRPRQIRRIFFVEFFRLLRVVWPILTGVLFAMVGPGLLIGYIEGWRLDEALYFTFVTGLTIGYGDLTPRHVVSRLLAVMIGFAGIVLTGLVAAVSVEALRATARDAGK